MAVYWVMFAIFAAGALSYASAIARPGMLPVSGPPAEAMSRRSVVLTITALALVVLIGLRYRVGGDWANYRDLFGRIAPEDLASALANSTQEPGYTFLNWLAAWFGFGMWFINLICAVPFTYGLFRLSRQQPNPWLALLVATPFLIVVVGMGYTRQASALGFLLVGLATVIERKSPVHFVLWTLAGGLFHRTVLVFIPIILTSTMRNRLLAVAFGLAAVILAYLVVLPAAIDRYSVGYVREKLDAAGATIRVLMDVVPAVILLASKGRFYWSPEEKMVWRTYAILCLIAGAALPFISSTVIIDRLAIYLIPIQIFVYGRIGYCFGLIRRGWLMWTTAVIVYSAAVMFVWLNYAVNAFAWVPYKNYLALPER